jgi:selenocysteine lyase/cysteine desulfurase
MINHTILQQMRADTPGVSHKIHLNNAGAALMPQPVIEAIREHITLEAVTGGYEAAAAKRKEIAGFYEAIARLLNAKPSQIAYASNATDAYNRALSSVPFREGDAILTTIDDYVSNQIAFLQLQKRFGVKLIRAESAPEGGVDPQSVKELIRRHRPRLVAVTHVPTSSGLVQPVEEIGRLCRDNDVLYLVDACQSAGQIDLDVNRLHCDFLSATFRKFLRGPRGAGFLFVSDKVLQMGLEPLFLDLHSAEWTSPDGYRPVDSAARFEIWERPYALLLGAKASAEYAFNAGLPVIEQRVKALADYCREQLGGINGVRVLDRGARLCGIVTLTIEGRKPEFLKARLDSAGINTSITTHGAALIDFDLKAVEWALRVSPHYYNMEEEIDVLVGVLREMV